MCLALAGTAPSARADEIAGAQRVLVILVTWGPEPFAQGQVRQAVFGDAATFVRASSYGRARVVGDTTPWLRAMEGPPRGCDVGSVGGAGRAAAARAGFAVGD